MEDEKFRLKAVKGDREYILECPPNSPVGELYDILSEMRSFVIGKIVEENQGKELQEDQSKEKPQEKKEE